MKLVLAAPPTIVEGGLVANQPRRGRSNLTVTSCHAGAISNATYPLGCQALGMTLQSGIC